MLNKELIEKSKNSVLCWLATSNKNNEPNVSPKEIFLFKDDSTLLIAHIASPNSISNIKENPNVCVSFIDIFVQKGFKIKGIAQLIDSNNNQFKNNLNLLTSTFTNKFPINIIIEVAVLEVDTIQAPSYIFFPETTEHSQIESAWNIYKSKVDGQYQ